MIILGIGGILGDAASAILKDGELIAAIEESKLARRRIHWGTHGQMPEQSIARCLDLAGVAAAQVDAVAVARPVSPVSENGFHLRLRDQFPNARVLLVDHHTAHAASAYYGSPFDEATVLTLDRGGDYRSGTVWQGQGNALQLLREQYFPDSLGDLFGRVTALLGMEAALEEHKVQWLSIAGDDRFVALFRAIINITDGSPRIDRSYFSTERVSHGGFSPRFFAALGLEDGAAIPDGLRAHVAAGVQRAVEAAVIEMAGKGRNLCLAGGLGLNSLLVSALETRSGFENVYVQPSAGNAGTALGAVLHAWHSVYGNQRRVDAGNLCLGPAYTAGEIKQVLENCKLRFRYLVTTSEMIDTAVRQLSENKIVAWMQGRMEFGSRALGNRSILASPLDPYSTENLNTFIKRRESFRKFAASVPAEVANEYFEVGPQARFLSTVGRVRPQYRERFSHAVLAGDMVRVHTVSEADNPLYWKLLHAAGKATGLPVLYNTSFNLFGEPLVCSPRDAARSFYSSGIDAMLLGNFFLEK